jgi:ankyrin repeat protein
MTTSPDVIQALIDAVWHADLGEARKLLASVGADVVNAHVYRQNTLLFFAVRVPGYAGHGDTPAPPAADEPSRVELIDLLVAAGADVNARNQRSVTPLHMAARYGLALTAAALLRHGADANARDANKETPLYRAANLGHSDVANLLLEHGADPNLPDRLGQTSLHRAALKGNLAMIEALLRHGAALEAKDRRGNTPLQVALAQGSKRGHVAELLSLRTTSSLPASNRS